MLDILFNAGFDIDFSFDEIASAEIEAPLLFMTYSVIDTDDNLVVSNNLVWTDTDLTVSANDGTAILNATSDKHIQFNPIPPGQYSKIQLTIGYMPNFVNGIERHYGDDIMTLNLFPILFIKGTGQTAKQIEVCADFSFKDTIQKQFFAYDQSFKNEFIDLSDYVDGQLIPDIEDIKFLHQYGRMNSISVYS